MSVICDVHGTIIYALMHASSLYRNDAQRRAWTKIVHHLRSRYSVLSLLSSLMSLDFFFVPLAAKVGASLDQVKASRDHFGAELWMLTCGHQLITCLLVSYPLGSLFIRIPPTRSTLRHLFSIFIASFYFVPVLNQGLPFLSLLGDVLTTYFVALKVQGPRMPWIVFG
jgi:hypothetical protein